MNMTVRMARRSAQVVLIAALAAACASPGPAVAPAAAPAPDTPSTPIEPLAQDILMRMAHTLGDAKSFSVSLDSDYDVLQESGEKITFAERRKLILERPGRMRAQAERSDGSKTSAAFTGSEIILVDETDKVYASAPQPGDLDTSIVYFVRDLGMRIPLAALWLARLPDEFNARVRELDYVEKTAIHGAPAHHIAARTNSVDFQLWISDGELPVPMRAVLTYRDAPGQPQFRARFNDWNFAPALNAATFNAAIPAGARKVAFASQVVSAQQQLQRSGPPAASAQGVVP